MINEHAVFERAQASLSVEELETLLATTEPPVAIFVAAGADKLLGYAAITFDYSLWRARCWAHLDCLFVREGNRGHSVGSALLAHARRFASDRGADRLEGQTPDWNVRGVAFYKREGAKITGKVRFHFGLH
jgi:GNAT superfamily N-acetyltransferase